MKKIEVITIFPEMIEDYSKISIIARAIKKKFIKLSAVNLRDFTNDPHKTVDGRPYGGGPGMVLKPDILQKAILKVAGKPGSAKRKSVCVIMLTPQGKKFSQQEVLKLSKSERLVFVCGRYEGFDERVRAMVDEEYSIGDYILMGGELPALVMIEAISRAYPGVVGKFESTTEESFAPEKNKKLMLEYPQYTRPEVLDVFSAGGKKKKMKVPEVLLSGNHGSVGKWRNEESFKRTKKRRPDLLA